MKITNVTLLIFAGLVLSSCQNDKPVQAGFSCVTPLSATQLAQGNLVVSDYQQTTQGNYVPAGWHLVAQGKFAGCYVPLLSHHEDTTIVP